MSVRIEGTQGGEPKRQIHPVLKFALELGPLGIFFFANSRFGIFEATASFMLATLVALVVSYALMRTIPIMPLVTGVVVVIFGGLTLWLQDELFIKLKPTIINLLFASVLLGGLAFGKPLLAYVFDTVFRLTPEGWRKLSLRWGLFFVFLAVLNEIVWRNFSTDTWVTFKVFGVLPLTLVFGAMQMPVLTKHGLPDPDEPQA